MPARPKILVLGATGQVGGALVSLLAKQDSIDVVAAVRNPEKAKDLDVPFVYLDLDKVETLAPALAHVDRLFMATGYTVDMLRQSKDLINAAKLAGVKQIVHLGACGDNDTHIAHYAWHQFIERYIEWTGVMFTHLRPEIFLQNLFGYGGVGYVKQGVIRHYVGSARLTWIDCDDVALVAGACLLHPEAHAGQTYRLGYDAKTFYDVADLLSAILGKPFTYEARPPSEFLENVLAAGAEPAYMKCVFDSYSDLTNGKDIGADEVFDNFLDITGREPTLLEGFIEKHQERFNY